MAAVTFKKPNRNFRRKLADRVAFVDSDSDSGNEANNDRDNDVITIDVEPEVTAQPKEKSKKKKKNVEPTLKKSSSAPKLLSFDEEDGDGEIFKIKKSSHSKRIARQLKQEQQAENVEFKPVDRKHKSPSPPANDSEDTEEKIKKLREEFRTLNGEEAEAAEVSDEDAEEGKAFKASLARGEIPDANMIHIIRKKRQMAREVGDFIPIKEAPQQDKSKSRLIREEDHDKSDDEEERIDFTVNRSAVDRQKIRDEFLAAEHGSDREDSDQERQWEEQQIRKATSGPMLVDNEQPAHIYSTGNNYYGDTMDKTDAERKNFEPFQALSKSTDSSEITIDSVKRRLKERLESLQEVHRVHVNERDELKRNIEEMTESIETCTLSCNSLEENFAFFQQTRGYPRSMI